MNNCTFCHEPIFEPNQSIHDYCANGQVSKLKVMKSAAGYYIGRSLTDENGTQVPYNRVSCGYYKTEREAESALESGYLR